jgi:CRISPR-associated protein Csd1
MILQELCRYYDRLAADPEVDVAPFGSVVQGVAFAVVVDESGELLNIQDLRDQDGKVKINKRMILPGKAKPPGAGINPSLNGWDRTDYMLGYLNPESLKPDEKANKLKRCVKAHEAYKEEMVQREDALGHPDYSAFCRFLRHWKPEMAEKHPVLSEVSGTFGVVRIAGAKPRYLHELPQFHEDATERGEHNGRCLVTGELAHIVKTHDIKIKGVIGAQSSGASLVSFNLNAFESYGRKQSFNAPVGEIASFKYATALNKLLERGSERSVRIGDVTCVFWADAPSRGEDLFGFGLSGSQSEDSDTVQNLEAALKSLKKGLAQYPDAEAGFHVLGISPNASRLSIRFWFSGTLGEMLERVVHHQQDLDIVRSQKDRDLIPAWLILAQTARESKDIPPLLSGALLRAILAGGRYPDALYAAILRRIQADRTVPHTRAAAIKAILTRNHAKEGLEMLKPERPEVAYQLGRLFAALEKAQEDALPGINATIKDRYFGAASATPGTVFPRLIRMSQHHIGKLEGGKKVVAEKRVQEICGRVDEFPTHLDLVGQGLFALGYYHQRQDFFTKKPPAGKDEQSV